MLSERANAAHSARATLATRRGAGPYAGCGGRIQRAKVASRLAHFRRLSRRAIAVRADANIVYDMRDHRVSVVIDEARKPVAQWVLSVDSILDR